MAEITTGQTAKIIAETGQWLYGQNLSTGQWGWFHESVFSSQPPPPGEQENIYTFWDTTGIKAWNVNVQMMVRAPHPARFYAQTFDLDRGAGGYFGLQERGDGSKVAIFSMWRNALGGQADVVQTGYGDCSPHSENGGGVRCFLPFNWDLNTAYTMRITHVLNDGTFDWWTAWAVPPNGSPREIARIKVAKSGSASGRINKTYTFVEDLEDQSVCANPAQTILRISRPTINAGAATLAYDGNNGGSNCANGSVTAVSGTQWDMRMG